MNKKIIVAELTHIVSLLEMASDLWKEDYSEPEMRSFFNEAMKSDTHTILLSLNNNIPAAFIFLSIRTDYVEGSDSSPTGYLEGIYVKPEFRKSGIANKLLSEGEKWLKEKGCKQIGSDAYIDNKISYDFHMNGGFKEAGRRVTFIKNID
jgi:aminoglycoside 6'-N-acetyltransferase I